MDVIWVRREAKYFLRQDWTGSISLIRFIKFAVARKSAGSGYASAGERPDRQSAQSVTSR
jgi:hypothetical protein